MEESFCWIFRLHGVINNTPANPANPLGRKYEQLQLHQFGYIYIYTYMIYLYWSTCTCMTSENLMRSPSEAAAPTPQGCRVGGEN
jgi:hypothetical protein